MGFSLLVFRVIEGELRAWKPARSLDLIGGFNKFFSILILQTLAYDVGLYRP